MSKDSTSQANFLGSAASILGLIPLLKDHRLKLFLTVLSAVCSHGAMLVSLGIAGWLAGRVMAGEAPGGLFAVFLGLAASIVATAAARWWQAYISHALAFSVIETLQLGVYDGLARAAPLDILGLHTGELASVAISDAALMEHFYAHTLADYCAAVLVPLVVLTAIFYVEPAIGIGLLPFLFFVASVPYWFSRRAQRQGSVILGNLGALNADTVEFVLGQRELTIFGRGQDFLNRLMRRTSSVSAAQRQYGSRAGLEQALIDFLTGSAVLVSVFIAITRINDGNLDGALLPLIVVLAGGALVPIVEVSQTARKLGELKAGARRILAILHQLPQVADTGRAPAPLGRAIRFQNVTFAYDANRGEVLKGLDLGIPAGSMVALAGRSGAGKSTVMNLLLRFRDPSAGTISIGALDIRDLSLDTLRSLIAYVPQDIHLFNETIADNIRLGRPDASMADVEEACRLAQADKFIKALPDGYETMCGESGAKLSGGERQRLAIARALVTKAPIILLDEASSNLDTESERAFEQALDSVRGSRTVILVAHRPSTIRRADRIVVLQDGAIVEDGSHATLAARGGAYARLIGEGGQPA